MYIAIIGDLVGSRSLENRNDVQSRMSQVLTDINESDYQENIVSRFVVTLGDEFQGLVLRTFPFQKFLEFYESKFGYNVQTRFGIGLGSLSTDLKSETIGMDGSCFHLARQAIEEAKKESEYLFFKGFEMNTALNALFQNTFHIRKSWKKRQQEVITVYKDVEDQVAVAKELHISRQAVSSVLKAAKWESYQAGWSGIHQLLAFSQNVV